MYKLRMICPSSGMDITHSSPEWDEDHLDDAKAYADSSANYMRQNNLGARPMIVNKSGVIVHDPRAEDGLEKSKNNV